MHEVRLKKKHIKNVRFFMKMKRGIKALSLHAIKYPKMRNLLKFSKTHDCHQRNTHISADAALTRLCYK